MINEEIKKMLIEVVEKDLVYKTFPKDSSLLRLSCVAGDTEEIVFDSGLKRRLTDKEMSIIVVIGAVEYPLRARYREGNMVLFQKRGGGKVPVSM